MFGLNFKKGWLSLVKYAVLVILVLWIWRSVRSDSTEYFAGETSESSEGFSTPILSDSTALNGFSEKFEVNDVNVLNRFNVGASNESPPQTEEQCKSCSAGGFTDEGVKLLPVMDPLFNMREICKQCVLIEDHLNNPEKRCKDCCQKHALTIEALAEEAVGLDKEGKYKFMKELPKKCREIQKECSKTKDKCNIAQKYRHIRKALMPLCFDRC